MSLTDNQRPLGVSVEEFLAEAPPELKLEILAGDRLASERLITSARIQKLGLALAGFAHYAREGRIQIVGQSEIGYLSHLSAEERSEALDKLDLKNITCVLITKNLDPPAELLALGEKHAIPVVKAAAVSSQVIAKVSSFLQEKLAPQITIHAVFMGIYGLGVLLLGDSGIGKSECALDLITRGHRLIADDAVSIKKVGETLLGSSPDLTKDHLEIRGLGVINVRDLFGVSATESSKNVDVCVELTPWKDGADVERLGVSFNEEEIFGVKIVKYVLPVSSGRNLSTLVETAIRLHLLKAQGYNPVAALLENHSRMLSGEK